MVERQRRGELREILEGHNNDFLYEICSMIGLPHSVPKYKKIDYLLESRYDFEYIMKKVNHLSFGFMVSDYLSARELRSIIDEHELPRPRRKWDMVAEIISSEKVSPREMLGILRTSNLESLYEEIFGIESDFDRDGIIRAIIDKYNLSWLEGIKGKGFILMAITDDPELEGVYQIIKNECEKYDIFATRVDEKQTSGSITEDVIEEIKNSDFIFVDLTMERPNVYYELGYAHGFGKKKEKIVLMARKDEKLHFDIRNLRTIFYTNHDDLIKKFRKRLHSIVG